MPYSKIKAMDLVYRLRNLDMHKSSIIVEGCIDEIERLQATIQSRDAIFDDLDNVYKKLHSEHMETLEKVETLTKELALEKQKNKPPSAAGM